MSSETAPQQSTTIEPTALTNPYRYPPLPAEGWTRVLELYPGSGHLSCSLANKKIDDQTLHFEALSYVWGSDPPEKDVSITCNACTLSIRPNLASALSHIRRHSLPRLLWVDAICINQEDAHERSLQVQRMGDIYSSATSVLVWLGEDHNHEAAETFALIKDTNSYLTSKLLQNQSLDTATPIPYHELIDAGPAKWGMVRRMMHSAWFTRVWVLQEVGLARSAVVHYGNVSMNFSYLVEFILFVALRADVAARIGNFGAAMIWDIFIGIWRSFGNEVTWRNDLPLTRLLNNSAYPLSFLDVLAVARRHQATDQRDRIYAFLSHPLAVAASHNRGKMIVADYAKSLDHVYLEATTHILETAQNPWTVLSCVDHKPESPSLSGQRPSWVPRWDEGWYVCRLGYAGNWYRAGGTHPSSSNASVAKSGEILSIQAMPLDTITWCSRSFAEDELSLEHHVAEAPMQQLWQDLQQQEQGSMYGQTKVDCEYAFSMTLAAGKGVDGLPAENKPAQHWSVYQEYQRLIDWDRCARRDGETTRSILDQYTFGTTLKMHALDYMRFQRAYLVGRRFFLTSKGYYGIAHNALKVGDTCMVIPGATVPFVVRKTASVGEASSASNRYRLVGEAYVQGIMQGELYDGQSNGGDDQDGGLAEETIILE
ncbi:MAG: hypothetical protein Q9193_004870 [Seirophora villosa]